MLTIREEQFAALNLTVVLQDPAIFMEHARTHHASVCGAMDKAALQKKVKEILAAGATRGIVSTRDLLTFLDLAMVFGLEWSDPERQWLDDGLKESDGRSISARLKRLRLEAIYRLEAEAAAR